MYVKRNIHTHVIRLARNPFDAFHLLHVIIITYSIFFNVLPTVSFAVIPIHQNHAPKNALVFTLQRLNVRSGSATTSFIVPLACPPRPPSLL